MQGTETLRHYNGPSKKIALIDTVNSTQFANGLYLSLGSLDKEWYHCWILASGKRGLLFLRRTAFPDTKGEVLSFSDFL